MLFSLIREFFFIISASATDASVFNQNSIRTFLADGVITFLNNSKSTFLNDSRSLPTNLLECIVLYICVSVF